MLKACSVILAVLILIAGPAHRAAFAQANFDRPGADYAHQPLLSGDPADCALVCEHDRRCRAWSFNYPNDRTETAVCWLKSAVPPRSESLCCISGVRGAGIIEQRTGPVENSTDRAGGDYRSFDIKADDKLEKDEACRKACEADNKCRAWTYARPRYAAKEARCFLKKEIKPPLRKPGFTSGVVR